MSIVHSMAPLIRFTNRVDNYVKYRPHYPREIITHLKRIKVLRKSSVVADIGSGTGILTELFLKNSNKVFGVEPNQAMRKAGEKYLEGYTKFVSINGTAEDTSLYDNSIDIITAGQAFHWFDRDKSKKEFLRILKPEGYLVLVWNVLKTTASPFLRAWHKIPVKYGMDYMKVRHNNITEPILRKFYGKNNFNSKSFPSKQFLDYQGAKGRLLSSSYMPTKSQPGYKDMMEMLKAIFRKYNVKGKVVFEYNTKLYWGKVS